MIWFDNCGYSRCTIIPKKFWQVFHFSWFDSWGGNFANEQCHKTLEVSLYNCAVGSGFKTDFPECSILHHLYFVLTFFICLTPQLGTILKIWQKMNDKQFWRFLDLYYVLYFVLKYLSHGLTLLEHEPIIFSTVDVHPEGSPGIHFQILCPPFSLLPPAPHSHCSVAFFLWLSEWLCHIWCAILLNDIMDLHMQGFL